jgi:hypothetical protein
MKKLIPIAILPVVALLLIADGTIKSDVIYDNVIVRTNLTLGGVARSTWPSGTGDLLADNNMTNGFPLLGSGGVTVHSTNSADFLTIIGAQPASALLDDLAGGITGVVNGTGSAYGAAIASDIVSALGGNWTGALVNDGAGTLSGVSYVTGTTLTTATNNSYTSAQAYAAPKGAFTSSGLTLATGKLLGRSTAGTGAAEEITVGSGLSLSGGSLTATGSGTGDVTGTGTPVDGQLVTYDSTTGKAIKPSTTGSIDTVNVTTANGVNWNANDIKATNSLKLLAATASSAAIIGADNTVSNSVTTATELSYVNGVTSAIQTQLNTKAPTSNPTFTGTAIAPTLDAADAYIGSISSLTNNILYLESAGNTNVVNMSPSAASIVTNIITENLAFAHATNGSGAGMTVKLQKFMVPSGGPYTLTIPAAWRTNVYSAVPPSLTNGTVTWMRLACDGPTDTSANQTNIYVSFAYFK